MRTILGGKLIGLYLYGSLVTGDFDDISDVDLLAATAEDIDEIEFDALDKMQNDLVLKYPQWENRLEIAYLSLRALKTFRTENSALGIISPGEPFHIIQAGVDWLMNWYMVREKGVALFGPPPEAIIDPISKDEFIQAVKAHAKAWRAYFDEMRSRPGQAYAILTMCRALFTCRNGEQVSKRQAALWAQKELPEWSPLINSALLWRQTSRQQEVVDHQATLAESRRFVNHVIDLVLS